MFTIKYLLLDEERMRLKGVINIEDFEKDLDTIVGQIEMLFNNNRIGFTDIDIPYNGEFIVTWLQLLNESIIYLEKYGFATICEPDSDNIWLEFQLSIDMVEVKEIKVDKQVTVLSYIEHIPKNYAELFWNDRVNKREFYDSISTVTNQFIEEIELLNPMILKSKDLQKLIACNSKVFKSFNI